MATTGHWRRGDSTAASPIDLDPAGVRTGRRARTARRPGTGVRDTGPDSRSIDEEWTMKARWLFAVLGLALVGIGFAVRATGVDRTIDVQGHRGARGLLPENSLVGFDLAQGLGVTTLETDSKVTSDGVLVLTHDSRLNPDVVRDTTGRWVDAPTAAIIDLTADALSTYDVGQLRPGSAYAARFPQQTSVDGTRIPTLSALFDQVAASGDREVRFNIETKIEPDAPELSPSPGAFARLLVDEIRSHGLQHRASIQSFDWRTLAEVQRIAPEITTVALTEADAATLDGSWTAGLRLADFGGSVPRLVAASGADVWSPDFEALTAEDITLAHDLGLRVIPWTLNDPADLARMIDLGVDGVISDEPDLAMAAARAATNSPVRPLAASAFVLVGLVLLLVGLTHRPTPASRGSR